MQLVEVGPDVCQESRKAKYWACISNGFLIRKWCVHWFLWGRNARHVVGRWWLVARPCEPWYVLVRLGTPCNDYRRWNLTSMHCYMLQYACAAQTLWIQPPYMEKTANISLGACNGVYKYASIARNFWAVRFCPAYGIRLMQNAALRRNSVGFSGLTWTQDSVESWYRKQNTKHTYEHEYICIMHYTCLYIWYNWKSEALCFMRESGACSACQAHVRRVDSLHGNSFQPITNRRARQQITTKLISNLLCESNMLKFGLLSRMSKSQSFWSVVKTRTVLCFFKEVSSNGGIALDNRIIQMK